MEYHIILSYGSARTESGYPKKLFNPLGYKLLTEVFPTYEDAAEFILNLCLPDGSGAGNFPIWEVCRIVDKSVLEDELGNSTLERILKDGWHRTWREYNILGYLFWHRENTWVKSERGMRNIVAPLPPEMNL